MTWPAWIILCTIVFALWFEFTGRRLGIAAIPMTPWQRRRVVEAVREHAPARDGLHIIELGSGWGGVVAALARAIQKAVQCHPDENRGPDQVLDPGFPPTPLQGFGGTGRRDGTVVITGYELFRPAYWFSRLRFMWRKNVRIVRADFFMADLSHADVVVCYLSHDLMAKLVPKFKAELKPGAIIVSNAFPLPSWMPIAHEKTPGAIGFQVFVYRI